MRCIAELLPVVLAVVEAALDLVLAPIHLVPRAHAVAEGVGVGANAEVLELDAAAAAVGTAIMRTVVAIAPLTRLLARTSFRAPNRPGRPRVLHLGVELRLRSAGQLGKLRGDLESIHEIGY